MITYGGVVLPSFPDAVREHCERHGVNDIHDFLWPSIPPSRDDTLPYHLPDRQPRLGQLLWPTGASRWTVGRFLMAGSDVQRLRDLAYNGATGYKALQFILDDGTTSNGNANRIKTDLFMLPPRPLDQIHNEEQLYLLTLVDERYFWQQVAADVEVDAGTTTWAGLYAAIATALGVTITVDAVEAAYLKPGAELSSRYDRLPQMLDMVCYCSGRRLVRSLDGTLTAQNPVNALLSQRQQLTKWGKEGGGLLAFDRNIGVHRCDLKPLVPDEVLVTFPVMAGSPLELPYTIAVTLTSLDLPEFLGITARDGSQIIRTSVTASGSGTPTNNTELTALAQRIATDWYRWQLGRQDTRFAGIVPYDPEGVSDHICWQHTEEDCYTRVQRGPWNDTNADMDIHGSYGSLYGCCGGVYYDGSTTYINSLNTILDELNFTETSVTLNTSQNNYSVVDISLLVVNATANIDITGFAAPSPEKAQWLQIINVGTYNLTLVYNSGSSSAANRIYTPSLTDITLTPGQGLYLLYDTVTNVWRVWCSKAPVEKPYVPSSFSTDQNDYALTYSPRVVHITPTADGKKITGFDSGVFGRVIEIVNIGDYPVKIPHDDSGSAAGNRVKHPNETEITVSPGGRLFLRYGSDSRWHSDRTKPDEAPYVPASFGTSQNNYNPGKALIVHLEPSAAGVAVTGLTGGWSSRPLTIRNVSTTYPLTLTYESGSSTAANRFDFSHKTDLTIPPGGSLNVRYSGSDSRWKKDCCEISVSGKVPATISSSQNNYNPGDGDYFLLEATAANVSLTGITNGWDGRTLVLRNNSATYPLTLKHESSSSTAGNRFSIWTAVDYSIAPGSYVELTYNSTASRWYIKCCWPVYAPKKPTQITSNQNNYSTGTYPTLIVNTDALRRLTGMDGGYPGRIITLINDGDYPLIITNNDSASSAANRIITGTGGILTLDPARGLPFIYDGDDSLWRAITQPTTPKHKYDASTAPTVTDDEDDGYGVGSFWFDIANGDIYGCINPAAGLALWRQLNCCDGSGSGGGGGGTIDTACCSDRLLPATLYATFGGSYAALGTVTLSHVTAESWASASQSPCGGDVVVSLICNDPTWILSAAGTGGPTGFGPISPDSVECDPLLLEYSFSASGTCSGAGTCTITETAP